MAVGVYVMVASWTLSAGLRPELERLQLLLAVAVACAVTAWCALDSQVLGRPIPRTFYFLIFFTWPAGAPIYLIWSRKSLGMALAVAHGLGLMSVWLACALLPHLLVSHIVDRGWDAIEKGETDRAVTLLSRAVQIESRNPMCWYALGAAYEVDGRGADAARAYREALALDSGFQECREALYWCLWKTAYDAQTRGDRSQAAPLYREAIALDNTEPSAWHNLALCYEALDSLPAATTAAQKASALDPDNQDYRTYLEFLKTKPPPGETAP